MVVTVLNADDNDAVRYSRGRLLRSAGYRVLEVSCGAEALAALTGTDRPDVAVVDVVMPDLSGIEVCRRAKADPATCDIQFLNISAAARSEADQSGALLAGADYYLTEPVTPEVLLAVVASLARNAIRIRDLRTAQRIQDQSERELLRAKAQLESMFNTLSEGLIVVDATGSPIFVNPAALAMHGLGSSEDFRLESISEAIEPSRLDGSPMPRSEWPVCRVLAGEKAASAEMAMRDRRTGRSWIAEYSANPFHDSAGRLAGVVVSARDVTRRNRMIDVLRRTEQRLSLAQRAASFGAWDWDMVAGPIWWSPEYYVLYGLAPDVEPGLDSWLASVHPDDRGHCAAAVEQAIASRSPEIRIDFRVLHPTGPRWFSAIGQTVFSDSGQPLRMTGITLDVHERKLAEQRLRESNEDLQRFAFAVSHDLQEPLRQIASFAELLSRRTDGRIDAQSHDYLRFITGGVRRMQALIEGLLQYSRVSYDSDLAVGPVDSNLVLGLALQQLQFRISETAARIGFDDLPPVRGNEGRLVQVFQNLIGNSLKYCDGTPDIHIAAVREGTEVVFRIRDNGIGIEPRHIPKLFGVFQRLVRRDEYPGSGVGLAICKRIVERHGGRIWVESQGTGCGSTFAFAVPAAEPADIRAEVVGAGSE